MLNRNKQKAKLYCDGCSSHHYISTSLEICTMHCMAPLYTFVQGKLTESVLENSLPSQKGQATLIGTFVPDCDRIGPVRAFDQ